jgi:hypothetical protein
MKIQGRTRKLATRILLAILLIGVSLFPAQLRWNEPVSATTTANVTIDLSYITNTMRCGLGASWHAMDGPINHPNGGSGWGGIPAWNDTGRWTQIKNHANWLGLDFCRIEIEQHMYEPTRNNYTWDSTEMKNLYNMLDWAEQKKVDVFLQQMWARVDWNTIPGYASILSAPNNLNDFVDGYANMVDYLVNTKGYTCIKYLGISNEPPSDWQGGCTYAQGLSAVRTALNNKGISIPLAGPDMYSSPSYAGCSNETPYLGAYELHKYQIDTNTSPLYNDWISAAHSAGLPFYMGEFGGNIPSGSDNSPGQYDYNMNVIKWVLKMINAGCDGFNRWSYVNRGNLDGQWQMVDTNDVNTNVLYTTVNPHPNTYYMYGLLTRFIAKKSSVMDCGSDNSNIVASALKSPGGQYSVIVMNASTADDCIVSITLNSLDNSRTFYRYKMTPNEKDLVNVTILPTGSFNVSPGSETFSDTVAANSIYVYSSYNLSATAEGAMAETPAPTPTPNPNPTPTPLNIAPSATVTVSSEYSSVYAGTKAVDGIIRQWDNGEWASHGELNPWIRLDWGSGKMINKIKLYDRPNLTDCANGGTLTFSDNSSINVAGLSNDGSSKIISFADKTVTWVKFEVSGGTGLNVGLSEIQIYTSTGGATATPGPTATAKPTPTPTATPSTGMVTWNDNNAAIAYTGTWYPDTSASYYSGDSTCTNVANSYFQFTFTGTDAKLYAAKDGSSGKADVYVDGTLKATVDFYNAARVYQQLIYDTGVLSNASHTLKLVNNGQKNAASNNYWLSLDKVEIVNGPTPTPTPAPTPGGDLALGKTAVASSYYNNDSTYAPGKAVDGDSATRWSSQFADNEWIYVDLGNTYSVNRVKLSWDPSYGKEFKIQVSVDAGNWSDVYSTTTGDGGIDDITFGASNARYVRMLGIKRGSSWGYSLWYFEVYGN